MMPFSWTRMDGSFLKTCGTFVTAHKFSIGGRSAECRFIHDTDTGEKTLRTIRYPTNELTGRATVTRTFDGDTSVRIGAPGDDHCTRGEWYTLLAHGGRRRPQLHSRVPALRYQSFSLLMDPSMHSHFGGVHHLVRPWNDRGLRRVVRALP